MKSTVIPCNSWHTGTDIKWTGKKSYWLEEGEEMRNGRAEASSAVGVEGKLQFHSCLMLITQVLVPCWKEMHVHILESSQLEDSYVEDLLYLLPKCLEEHKSRESSWICIADSWATQMWTAWIHSELYVLGAVLTLSVISDSLQTPRTVAHQAPLSMGILQARTLDWVAMPSSRGSSQPRDWTQVSCILGRFCIVWATREATLHELFFFFSTK